MGEASTVPSIATRFSLSLPTCEALRPRVERPVLAASKPKRVQSRGPLRAALAVAGGVPFVGAAAAPLSPLLLHAATPQAITRALSSSARRPITSSRIRTLLRGFGLVDGLRPGRPPTRGLRRLRRAVAGRLACLGGHDAPLARRLWSRLLDI